MIPRLLHYVWVGSPLPDKQRSYIETWRETNPDFEIICWNENNIDFSHRMIKRAYKRREWAKVADIARLMAVNAIGGIYLDTDFAVCKSLDGLLDNHCFYAFQHEERMTDLVGNGAFGAEPGHWFVRKALERLLAKRPLPLERPTSFGPKLITSLLREEGLDAYSPNGVTVKDVMIYPKPVFYPFSWDEEFSDSCVEERTLAIHFWEQSWQQHLPWAVRFLRRVKNGVTRMAH